MTRQSGTTVTDNPLLDEVPEERGETTQKLRNLGVGERERLEARFGECFDALDLDRDGKMQNDIETSTEFSGAVKLQGL